MKIEEAMQRAVNLAQSSDSPYTKVGCIITNSLNTRIADGVNTIDTAQISHDKIWQMPRMVCREYVTHAEVWAVVAAMAINNVDTSRAFCTLMPCVSCIKLLRRAGVSKVYYLEEKDYDKMTHEVAEVLGVSLIKITL